MLAPMTPAPAMMMDGIEAEIIAARVRQNVSRPANCLFPVDRRGPVASYFRSRPLRVFAVCGADARHGSADAPVRRGRAGAACLARGGRVLRDDRGRVRVAGRFLAYVLGERRVGGGVV